ncbi:MAG: transcription-repair coupling factor [Bacteroidaceae bacterium]|nr:transcription-repair coupling factor [Bacteroidaceae bacterium]
MEIQKLQTLFSRHLSVGKLRAALQQTDVRVIQIEGLHESAAPLVFASLSHTLPKREVKHSQFAPTRFTPSLDEAGEPTLFLFILDDEEQAGYFYHDLTQVLDEKQVLFFPSSYKRAVKYGQRDAGNEILRTEVLSAIQAHFPTPCSSKSGKSKESSPHGKDHLYIVTHPQALAQKVVTRKKLSEQTLALQTGEQVDIVFVQETLMSYGFKRVDYVYEPGQFAVRGSILDVYSYSCEFPYRIDFFGDEVDSIRTFEVQSQLSKTRLQQISIVPELDGQCPVPNAQCSLSDEQESFLSFLPKEALLVMRDPVFVTEMVRQTWDEGFCHQAVTADAEELHPEPEQNSLLKEKVLVDPQLFTKELLTFRRIELKASSMPSKAWVTLSFHTHPQPVFHKNFELVFQNFRKYQDDGYQLFILADSQKQTARLESIFQEQQTGIAFTPVNRTIHAGFVDDDLKLCLFTDHQIFDRYHKYNLRSQQTRSGKVALTLKELQQFEIGDYVVHLDHGVGRFGGLVRIPVQNSPNSQGTQCTQNYHEVIKIIYNHDDVVFVSIHALHKVSKYKGKEGEPPRISTLGTGAWERMKERTKTKIKDIARDLIKLYSRRREEKGFCFSPDSFMQHELEASFLYEDTPDQLKATQDVKADMERSRPMDRLVCGDVGFGKTEVAIRAAFKACADNKQVAILVPTTVLAYQHFRTFSARLKDFPVRIEYLSRAKTAAQTKEIIEGLKNGKVDIVVGTHKLIGKNIKFKDLGLLVIDEEQKFGVSTKEKLRQMKVNVDTLTLTATPIPRTLQFSLMGARDLSVIQTPPPNRYPIQTQLSVFSSEIISEAINFEMSRNGQVFFVNNRISNLPDLEALIHKYVPDARVAVAHGQMPPEKLEDIMMGFANYDYDVLLSTTIIESGLDIPNANTIIINSAQNFGLSDLHQMRGRVGRSNKKAFCYLLAPPLSALNIDARRRLQAIENFSDLGSGIHIAMQDLDIRGAGNLLGAEQSGFIADLGYEAYQKILSQAVKELRNDEFQDLYKEEVRAGNITEGTDFVEECVIESDLPMSFSEEYVPTSSERMLLYRELDGLERDEDVEQFRQRMTDRFGTIPPEGEELIGVVKLRRLGRYFGCERIVLKQGRMRMQFISNSDSAFYDSQAFHRVIAFATANAHICRVDNSRNQFKLLISEVTSVGQANALLSQMQKCAV